MVLVRGRGVLQDEGLDSLSRPKPTSSHREQLRTIAIAAMRARGLDPDFPADVLAQVAALSAAPASPDGSATRDLRGLLWCSIDNDDSRDLDQLSVAKPAADGAVNILVAIADVDAVVGKGSPVDRHASVNTTSVYTPAAIFPMLPEKLSTDLTSLNDHEDRLTIVIEMIVGADGTLVHADLYRASVRNQAKLAYNAVGAWLTGEGPLPPAAAAVDGMDRQLQIQDRAAQALNAKRHEHGALDFETLEVSTEFDGDTVRGLRPELPNRAKSLIENLMVAANGATARFLDAAGLPSIRRVVLIGMGTSLHSAMVGRTYIERLAGLSFEGIAFYPGHIKDNGAPGRAALAALGGLIQSMLADFRREGIAVRIVSGGSTPSLYHSHELAGLNEIRPGTYVYNDWNTVASGACTPEECAAALLVTVVSTARPGQIIVDGGSKTFSSDRLAGSTESTFGHVVEAPEAVFHKMNEEHGYVDVRQCGRKFEIGERLRIIPNHICVAVNLHERVYGIRNGEVEEVWEVAGRGKLQ